MRYIIIIIAVFISGCSPYPKDKELTFTGRSFHHDPQIATEIAKQEAIEKLLFAAGITVEGRMTDTLDYAKVYSSAQPKEKGEIKFSKTIMVMHSFLKDLNLQMETKVIPQNNIYMAIVTFKVNKGDLIRAKKAGRKSEKKKQAKQKVFRAKTWKLMKYLIFVTGALIIIIGTLSIADLRNLLAWQGGIHPLGLLIISISTILIILLYWFCFAKMPGFIIEIIPRLDL